MAMTTVLLAVLLLTGSPTPAPKASPAQAPKASPAQAPKSLEPCALVTGAEVATLAGVKVGAGQAGHIPQTGQLTCKYQWKEKDLVATLEISLGEVSKMLPGADAAMIKSMMVGETKHGSSPTPISDVGEAAAYKQNSPHSGYAAAFLKGKILELTYNGADSAAKKDRLIALLKAAAARV
ncbi:MAG: hypothetical protein U0167_07525 [bacterium]